MTKNRTSPAVELLARTAPFDRLDAAALGPLASNADRLHLAAGTILARDAEPAQEFVTVLRGSLIAVDAEGHHRRLLPGSTVGGDELVAGTAHRETVIADGPVEVLVVNGPAYRWARAELLVA